MSIHPSLSSSAKDKKQRTVLKRTERLRILMEKGKWNEGDSVFGLPKIKTVRIKIKKEKAAEKPETATAESAAVTPSSSITKEQPVAKATTPKSQDKK